MTPEVVVERNHPMYFSSREIQGRGNDRNRRFWDESQSLLHGMQDLQQWTGLRLVLSERAIDFFARVCV